MKLAQIIFSLVFLEKFKKTLLLLLCSSGNFLFSQTWEGPFIAESNNNNTGGGFGKTAMAIVDGKAAVAYQDDTHKNILFVKATDLNGTAWGNPITVVWEGSLGNQIRLKVINGNPAIVYSAPSSELYFIRASDPLGTSWGDPVLITSSYNESLSFDVIGGNPAIAFEANNGNIQFIRATDQNGTGWGAPVSLGIGFTFTSLKEVNGNPAVFYNSSWTEIKYIRATSVDGSTWGSPVTIYSGSNFVLRGVLEVTDGNPSLGFGMFDGTSSIYFKRANDINGDSWGTDVLIDFQSDLGLESLRIVDGYPAFFYFYENTYTYKIKRANNAIGSSWGSAVTVGGNAAILGRTGFAIVNGNPAVSGTIGPGFNFTRASNTTGSAWNANVTISTIPISCGFFPSATMVAGQPAAVYYSNGYSTNTVRFSKANNINDLHWQSSVVVKTNTQYARNFSLGVMNGNPAVAFSEGNSQIEYTRANNPDGTSWPSTVAIVPFASGNKFGSVLKVVSGNPAIVCYHYDLDDVKFIRADDANGTGWGSEVTVDADADAIEKQLGFDIINGNPAVAYKGMASSSLKFNRATNATGSSWGTPITVATNGLNIGDILMTVVNGNPAIVYAEVGFGIRYVRANDVNGNSWGTPMTIYSSSFSVGTIQFTVNSGKPLVSFSYANVLYSIVADDANGTTWGTPDIIDETNSVGRHSLFAIGSNQVGVVHENEAEGFPTFNYATIVALPLELTGFNAQARNASNLLQWQTASETQTSHFEIERSANGSQNFEKIGEMRAAGQSADRIDYEFTDRQPLKNSYYRLKMVDLDGKFSYSKVVFVKNAEKGLTIHSILPNPVTDEFSITFHSELEGEHQLTLFNTIGQIVFSKKLLIDSVEFIEKINIQSLPAGTYLIEITNESQKIVEKLMKKSEK